MEFHWFASGQEATCAVGLLRGWEHVLLATVNVKPYEHEARSKSEHTLPSQKAPMSGQSAVFHQEVRTASSLWRDKQHSVPLWVQ